MQDEDIKVVILTAWYVRITNRLELESHRYTPCASSHEENEPKAGKWSDDDQNSRFNRTFGKAKGDIDDPVEEIFLLDEEKRSRQTFAAFILCTTQSFLRVLPNLRGLEVGIWEHGEDDYR